MLSSVFAPNGTLVVLDALEALWLRPDSNNWALVAQIGGVSHKLARGTRQEMTQALGDLRAAHHRWSSGNVDAAIEEALRKQDEPKDLPPLRKVRGCRGATHIRFAVFTFQEQAAGYRWYGFKSRPVWDGYSWQHSPGDLPVWLEDVWSPPDDFVADLERPENNILELVNECFCAWNDTRNAYVTSCGFNLTPGEKRSFMFCPKCALPLKK